jgi:protocatechuate 3,4-dioxygenase beta subunit
MHVKRPILLPAPVLRRDVLRGFGAMAVASPALAALGCGSSSTPESLAGPENAGGSQAGSSLAGSPAAGNTGSVAGSSAVSSNLAGHGAAEAGHGGAGGAPASASSPAAGSGGHAGGNANGSAGAGGAAGTNAAGNGAAGSAGASATVPMFADAASCTLTTTDIEGPFYIDEQEVMNDESMVRSDIREGLPGCEFRLFFRVLDAKQKCAPIAGTEVYIWHCNADGYYSGFDGQDPSKPYMGSASPSPTNLDRFCRGIQIADSSGVVGFTTVYPGWYAGRPLHIHVMARMKGATTRLITTQLYFPAAFTREVHQSEPAYMARAANLPAGSANPPTGKPAMPTVMHTPGLIVGTLNVIVDG